MIPFFSKKTKKYLKDNEARIHLLTKEQQEKFLKDPNIKLDNKLYQLLKENNELRVLYDNLQDQFAKELKAGGNYMLEISSSAIELYTDIKVLPDNQIQYKGRTVDIDAPEKVFRLKTFGRTKQARVWCVEPEGEYTYDPRDETPIEIKKRSESIIKIKNMITKSTFIETILKGLSGIKKWFEYIPWIVFGATLIFLAIIIFYYLSGYQLISKSTQVALFLGKVVLT